MARPKEFDDNDKLLIARNLFWEKGYNNTSLNDLIDKLKINKSSFYNTFGSKHELFLNCLNNYLQEKEIEYHNILNSEADPILAIENALEYVLNAVTLETKTCLSVNSTFELARIDEQVNALLKEHTLTRIKMFESLLIQAKKNRQINMDQDPKALAHYIVAAITSLWSTHLTFSDQELTRQIKQIIVGILK